MLHTHARSIDLKASESLYLRILREFGGEGVVHFLSSEPGSYSVYRNHILTDIEYDVKGCLVSTIFNTSKPYATYPPPSPRRLPQPLHSCGNSMTSHTARLLNIDPKPKEQHY
jgi:hypothetical protein